MVRRIIPLVTLSMSLLLGVSGVARADTAVCSGLITQIANHANGGNGLYVVVGNGSIFKVCSFTSTQFTVSPEDCRHMASLAQMAMATEKNVSIWIDNAPTAACASIGNWHVANVRYFNVSN
jgi:hypothetical protein